jgi:hypothetical protein
MKGAAKMAKISRIVTFSIVLTLILGSWSLPRPFSMQGQTSLIAAAYAQDVGTLHVVITPQEAIDDGAQWRVDGGTWHNSGVYLGLEVGSHTIEYKAIDGWDAPSNEAVDIVQDQITEVTGIYSQETGSLVVTLIPQGAIDAGAQWNVDEGLWQDAGAMVGGLSSGDHTVNYKDVFGWGAPPSETVTILGGQITETTGTYTQLFGSLQVTISPQAVIDAGAQWDVDGGEWQESGAIVSVLSVGDHIVTYRGVFGWLYPPDEIVTVYNKPITEITACYVEISGSIIHVPTEYTTIQAAIDAASNGDTVLVADGTYVGLWNKDLDFNGKAIKLVSENGPENCIIDCEGSGRGFYFHSGEREDSVVSGFTITHGSSTSLFGGGGGIYCVSSSPTITKCIISGNNAFAEYGGFGGGISCYGGSPVITNCIISGNVATGYSGSAHGGGISSYGGSPVITNCIISGNKAHTGYGEGRGGGIHSSGGSPVITNCTITENRAWSDNGGGGIDSYGGSPVITNSILWDNIPNQISGVGTVTYSDIQGGYPSEGNIDADPLFADPDNDDYHLTSDSPCIDTGTSEGAPNTDIDGTPRPQGIGYDMGAYEFEAIVYVAPDGLCDGNTPCYPQIQDGIDWDGIVFTIRADQGIYDENIVFDEPKEISFEGGWDSIFESASGVTSVNSMTISDGTVVLDEGCLGIVSAGD